MPGTGPDDAMRVTERLPAEASSLALQARLPDGLQGLQVLLDEP